MNKSLLSLSIAILIHILLFSIIYILFSLQPKTTHKPDPHKIKVALKQIKKPTKSASVHPNKQPLPIKVPSMPKGKQLNKIDTFVNTTKTTSPSRTKLAKKEPTRAINTPYKLTKKIDSNSTKPVKKSSSQLYSFLSKKQTKKVVKKHTAQQRGSQISDDFKEAYGEAFGKLSSGEQQYLLDNQEIMRRITQEQLNRLAPVNIPRNLNINTMNIIEFYLHPNGDISGLKIIDSSGQKILDQTSLQTIEYSYHRYPPAKQKTLIRYKVGYYLGRY